MTTIHERQWLVLIHQLPPTPNYFRVKIWRRLQQLGAVAIKRSVYALPKSEQAHEAFEWVMREITAGGGEASLCEARFVEGLRDEQVEALFKAARAVDYTQLVDETRKLAKVIPARTLDGGERTRYEADLARLKRRLAAITAIDFFATPARQTTAALIQRLETRVRVKETRAPISNRAVWNPAQFKGYTWVTRKHVYIDRMASAWLIRRFLDLRARFKFVESKTYAPGVREVRFDMFDGEFTHEGDQCTFEVLVAHAGLRDPALAELAEIVHEIDLKDGKFVRDDVAGVEQVLTAIASTHSEDTQRLERSAALLDDLYAYFAQRVKRARKRA